MDELDVELYSDGLVASFTGNAAKGMCIRRQIHIGSTSSRHFDVDPTSNFHFKKKSEINNRGATIIPNIRVCPNFSVYNCKVCPYYPKLLAGYIFSSESSAIELLVG